MTIFELGALGEFIGAIAVVITLIYLAIQIRQNTNSMNESRKVILAQTRNEMARGVQEICVSVSQSMQLADVVNRSIRGEELTPTQAIMYFSRNEACF